MSRDTKRYRMLVQVAVEVDAYSPADARLMGVAAVGVEDGLHRSHYFKRKPLREQVRFGDDEPITANATYTWSDAVLIHEAEPDDA